jgi:hypothetical protein
VDRLHCRFFTGIAAAALSPVRMTRGAGVKVLRVVLRAETPAVGPYATQAFFSRHQCRGNFFRPHDVRLDRIGFVVQHPAGANIGLRRSCDCFVFLASSLPYCLVQR